MNFKKSALASAITLATFATGAAAFDASSWEVSGFVKNETAALQGSGTFIGQESTSVDTTSHNDSGDVIKFENTAKVFINGDVAEDVALHAELNFVYDTEATPNDYQGHMNYSQNDYLRELYVDTMVGDTEIRVGKQQVVWGTADGMKLLDIINPTDYREFAQNTMEDSRIPVWMIKTDTPIGESGSLQFVVSQAEENKIAGLNASGDQGNPYIMKGVDSITGKVNGFLNIGPAMGGVSRFFAAFADPTTGSTTTGVASLRQYTYTRVHDYVNAITVQNVGDYNSTNPGYYSEYDFGYSCVGGTSASWCEASDLNYVSETTNTVATSGGANVTGGSNQDVTNLIDATSSSNSNWDVTNPNSTFEYMDQAAFSTFAAFVNMQTEFRTSNMPKDLDSNLGVRFKNALDNGLNYSVNYLYAYDSNPYIDLHWEDADTGTRLNATKGSTLSRTIAAATSALTADETYYTTPVDLRYADGTVHKYETNGAAKLVFDQKMARIHNLGGAFDYTIETESLPVVLRGEFLYQKDVKTPVINRAELRIGNITEALKSEDADFFKYVIGADVNVLTNMLVSGQFIQIRNLDFVDESVSVNASATGQRYTGDMATLHLSNGLQKAHENKEFYSLFLSKPFGPNQLGRWNNIFMFEEGGGKWNRFDVEYSFSDELVGSFELNNYWGDANTQFGQMEDSSNIQVGLKYLF
jgi:hypothetical protein